MSFEEELKQIIQDAIKHIGLSIELIELSQPKQALFGDLSTNVAFLLARQASKAPQVIARDLISNFQLPEWIEKTEVAGAGYINFYLRPSAYFQALKVISKEKEKFGRRKVKEKKKVILEFVSANPTGPLNVVSARAAAVGDALANILDAAGFEVHKEFYVNDVGNQIELFAESLEARLKEAKGETAPIPEGGYHGEYLKELALALAEQSKKSLTLEVLKNEGLKAMVEGQKKSLEKFGVVFDRWYFQSELLQKNLVEKSLKHLEKAGHLYEQDGALFFKSSPFGDDKDRVVRKQDGAYSYFASDIAYHWDKFLRKFDWAIDLLGPDHHGYIARTRAAVQACGYKAEQLTVLIVQQVHFVENQMLVKMSKRSGKLITMDTLLEEVGRDVARYFFLQRSVSSPLEFDLELAKKETLENPVFYIQYAHARIASIFRKAGEEGITPDFRKIDCKLLDIPEEKELARELHSFPQVVSQAALDLAPHLIATYALQLARQLQSYYSQAKQDARYRAIDPSNLPRTAAKLYLLKNIQIVLQNALALLGISAPERMAKNVIGTI